jgi:hypothetical protein
MKREEYYLARWENYRLRFWAITLVMITYLPAQMFLAPLLARAFPQRDVGSIVFLIWALGIVASSIYFFSWRCPRCNKHYFSKSLHHDPFARKCLHCKLPKWATKSVRKDKT